MELQSLVPLSLEVIQMNHQPAKESSAYPTRHIPAVERTDVADVAEDGLLATADFRWRALLVNVLQMVRRDKVHLLYELFLTGNELLDELAFHTSDTKTG